tara:strand:+ start:385 stop:1473 length:1089 start_codon:yes stop_codon:yes gene_type:complete
MNDRYVQHNDLGVSSLRSGDLQKAKNFFEKAIEIDSSRISAHNNLGLVFKELGELESSKNCFEKVIKINSNHEKAHNNLGIVLLQSGDLDKAKSYFEKAIKIKPDYLNAYWNLHSFSQNIDEALTILKKICKIDESFIKAKIMITALQGFKGNFSEFNTLNISSVSKHPYMRSVKWIFSLPQLPKIFFNRWSFFDGVSILANKSRPFYEFGVWYGVTFKYLINTFKKGFGFDTFTGLPESWHHEAKGHYSSFGSVPKIDGGEFIVGKFEDTLPKFFSNQKPMASLINFDADLYSSTLCALNYSNKVIDDKTILVFDEFIMSDSWEKDEYKALNDFCNNLGFSYEVIAVSFFSKQVAVKLIKN